MVTYARSGSMSLAVIISSINRICPSTYPCLGKVDEQKQEAARRRADAQINSEQKE